MENLVLAYILIVVGLILMAAELFLPTAGVVGVVGVAGVIAGVAIAFNQSTTQGMVSVVVILVIVPSLGPVLLNYWPRTRWGKKFVLSGTDSDTT
ncbi:MAG: hypothetical protein NZO58_13145, partial [Gemmataceae bacterium]|nr:hypothetical protein [Gemmataceae bacterium]